MTKKLRYIKLMILIQGLIIAEFSLLYKEYGYMTNKNLTWKIDNKILHFA